MLEGAAVRVVIAVASPLFPPARGTPRVSLAPAYFGAPAATCGDGADEEGNGREGGASSDENEEHVAESGASPPGPFILE